MFWHAWLLLVIAATCTEGDQSFRTNCIDEPNDKTACIRGCKPGYRGSFCNETCSEHCGGACSQDTGHCLTGCKPNWFTSNCSQPCSGNCVDDVCDRRSAECLRACKDGFYGLNCNETCSGNCTKGKCDIYGGCDCEKGVLDKFCYIDCTDNCIGGACDVDLNGTLKCLRGCKEGRTGPFCNVLCPYDCPACDDSCVSRVMNRRVKRATPNNCREDSNCQHGYRGPNCNIPCPACRYGRNCSLYCAVGSWGEECHIPCPKNCSRASNGRSFCDHESGQCENCLQGYYGYLCELKCSRTCKQNYCSINNGRCSSGCKHGYWGQNCKNRCGNCLDMKCEQNGSCICIDKYYGPRCEDSCSEGCDGNCSITNDGNHMCNGECKVGYSGDDCIGGCPEGCRSSGCRRKDGTCADSGISTQSSNLVSTLGGIAIIISLVALTLFIIIVIIIIIVILRRKKMLCWKPQSSIPSGQRHESTVDHVTDGGINSESTPMLAASTAASTAVGEDTATESTPRRGGGPPQDHETAENDPLESRNVTEDHPPDAPDAGIPMESTQISSSDLPMPVVSTAGSLVAEETAVESTPRSEGGPPQDHETIEHNTVQNRNSTEGHLTDIPDGGTTTESIPMSVVSTAGSLVTEKTAVESTPRRKEIEESPVQSTNDEGMHVTDINNTEDHHPDISDTRITTESTPLLDKSTEGSFNRRGTIPESTPRREDEPSYDDETNGADSNSTEGHLTDIPDRGTTAESIPMPVVSAAGSIVTEETAVESTPLREEGPPQHHETIEDNPVLSTNDAGPPDSHHRYTAGTEENEFKDLH